MAKRRRNTMVLLVTVLGLIMINCAGTPDKNPVGKTQQAFNKIKNDTLVVRNAPDELEKAREAIENVKKSMKNNDDSTSIEQQTLLAEQRIKIAKKTAELHTEQAKIKDMSEELNHLLADARKIERERVEAGLAKLDINERVKYLHNFRILHTDYGLVLRFSRVTFNSEKAYLKSSAQGTISELTDFLNQYPERNIRIEGYTDNTGTKGYNKKLSQERADAVRQALISRGIKDARIQAIGMGEQYPIANNKSKTGRKRNRRVEVVISDKNGVIPARSSKN